MTDRKGFRKGFLLVENKRQKKKDSQQKIVRKSSTLLELENPPSSIFEIADQDYMSERFITEGNNNTKRLLYPDNKTKGRPESTLLSEVDGFLDRKVTIHEHTPNVTSDSAFNLDSVTVSSKSADGVKGPRWLIDESIQPKSPTTSELIHIQPEEMDYDITKELSSTLLRMKRNTDWRTVGFDFVQLYLKSGPKRKAAWNFILEGDLTLAKTRLAICMLQDEPDLLIEYLRDSERKYHYQIMRCLMILDYQLAQDDGVVSLDLVGSFLPGIGNVASSDQGKTILTKQAMDVGIKMTALAASVGLSKPEIARLLHSKMSTVNLLLDTQKTWLYENKNWFTLDGSRSWCKYVIVRHWQAVNHIYQSSETAVEWCRVLQGLEKQDIQIGSFASTLLQSLKLSAKQWIVILQSILDGADTLDNITFLLTGLLSWLSRKGMRNRLGSRETRDRIEDILLNIATQYPVLVLPALNSLWSIDGFVPRDVHHTTVPRSALPRSLDIITTLLADDEALASEKLNRDFVLNTLFHCTSLIGRPLFELLLQKQVAPDLMNELASRLAF